jgi:uncharacterized protein (DUF2252 family)
MGSRHPDERMRAGADVRRLVPPDLHAGWTAAPDRPDPIALLESQASTRIPQLVPVRYGRMLVSPFTYFRGAALPMAADLAATPTSGVEVQLGGDAHLSNFGLFASPERNLLFDMNDFDETLPGPWEWDLKRLVASLVVAARDRGFDEHDARHAARAAAGSYRTRMAEYAGMRAIDVYYARVDVSGIATYVDKRARPYLEDTVREATHHDTVHELPKLTELIDGRRRIIDVPPTIYHPTWADADVPADALAAYRLTLQEDRRVLFDRYELVDIAMKVVGVGSVGLAALAVLFGGGHPDDPLLLQVKEAEASVLERFLAPSEYTNHGERVVAGQRRLQAASDVLLGWSQGRLGRHIYIVRHRGDDSRRPRDVGRALRVGTRPRPCTVGRPGRDLRVPRRRRGGGRSPRCVRRGICGPDRTGSCGVRRRREVGAAPGRDWRLRRSVAGAGGAGGQSRPRTSLRARRTIRTKLVKCAHGRMWLGSPA